jgi:2-amino-4-hydroxy-6-hydroxymethyldihydropteridine diphosphokinase
MRYFLCLGSNTGDKRSNIKNAISFLQKSGVRLIRSSSQYKTQPVEVGKQPWFVNQVLEVETDINSQSLLEMIKDIEEKMGRKKNVKKGPRSIDIDILLAEDSVIREEDLVIPHPRLEYRNFVLVPLSEISPSTVHPLLNITIGELARDSEDTSCVIRL